MKGKVLIYNLILYILISIATLYYLYSVSVTNEIKRSIVTNIEYFPNEKRLEIGHTYASKVDNRDINIYSITVITTNYSPDNVDPNNIESIDEEAMKTIRQDQIYGFPVDVFLIKIHEELAEDDIQALKAEVQRNYEHPPHFIDYFLYSSKIILFIYTLISFSIIKFSICIISRLFTYYRRKFT